MTSELSFTVSKIVGLLIRGETWLFLALVVTLLMAALGWRRATVIWAGASLVAVWALAALPVGDWATAPLERRYAIPEALDPAPDGIIVLGGAVETRTWRVTGQIHFNEAGERLTEGLRLAKRFPEAKVLLSGGGALLGPLGGEIPTEAATMAAFLALHDVAGPRVRLEDQSRNTADNAALSYALAQPAPTERWVLVTSAWHMPRAMAAFERAGWSNLTAWPVDFTHPPGEIGGLRWDLSVNLFYLNRSLKEYVGALAHHVQAWL